MRRPTPSAVTLSVSDHQGLAAQGGQLREVRQAPGAEARVTAASRMAGLREGEPGEALLRHVRRSRGSLLLCVEW